MIKVKLFTHTDLDGAGCSVLAKLVYGYGNVDVTYTGPGELEEELMRLVSVDTPHYDVVYVTDINITKSIYNALMLLKEIYDVRVFDHHITYTDEYEIPDWMTITTCGANEVVASGTSLFCDYLISDVVKDYPDADIIDLRVKMHRFSEIVRLYDTFEFRYNPNFVAHINICQRMNKMFSINGIENFVDIMVDRIHTMDTYTDFFTLQEGEMLNAIIKHDEATSAKIAETAVDVRPYIEGLGYVDMLLVYSNHLVSSIGYAITSRNPDKVACIINPTYNTMSFRSDKSNPIHCGELAKCFGGGGHPCAAGAPFPTKKLTENFVATHVFGRGLTAVN